jgi:phosphomannomutase
LIVSASGVRGVLNQDIYASTFVDFARRFANSTGSQEILLARDTRSTGILANRAVVGELLSLGARVVDYGVISTPALFRESRVRKRPAIMLSASHNEPEFNGIKFMVNGIGVGADAFSPDPDKEPAEARQFLQGSLVCRGRASYGDDLVQRFGEGSCQGVGVALDLGGGAAIAHAPAILKRLGCEVVSMNDTPGLFSRRVDPISDELLLLQKMVRENGCAIGLGFDCDGDRLAIVDNRGRKRTGDFMLTLALSQRLGDAARGSSGSKVVVSVDTTQAVDEVAEEHGGKVFRSKVGEANVVGLMQAKGISLGGEGSSGGLIDGSFNYCRDSMLAALTIIRALKQRGTRIYDEVRSYHQERVALRLKRSDGLKAIKLLASKSKGADTTDGVKLWTSGRSWVLIRASGTEDVVRVSAEAESKEKAKRIAEEYSKKLKELSK